MGATGTAPSVVRVDGGAAVMDLLLQHLADQARLEVLRPRSVETTALGAATMAGLAEGVWGSLDDLAELWTAEASFAPQDGPADRRRSAHEAWMRSVERSRGWVTGTGLTRSESGSAVDAAVRRAPASRGRPARP